MRLHAVTLLSTHYHLCATDVRGVHPNFTRRLNRLFANFTKVHRGWSGQVFNGSRPSVVRCNTPLSVVDKIGYTIANPVAAGAVRLAREWPGVTTRVDDMDRRILTIRRPERYFDDRGELPDVVELRIEVPPVLIETFGEEESRRLLRTSITEHEEKAREAVRDKDWTFLGGGARAQDLTVQTSDGVRSPRLAESDVRDQGRRTDWVLRSGRRASGVSCRLPRALRAWRAGVRDVVFPAGTWFMRVFHGAACAPSG